MADEENSTVAPETFDIDAWLQDAHLPEDSCVIYKRPDVIAELTQLKARIEDEEAAGNSKTVGGGTELRKLRKRYDELLETFGASRVTVYVRALSESRIREMSGDYKAKGGTSKDDAAALEQGYAVVAESVVGLQDADGERKPVRLTVEQVKALEDRISGSQLAKIREAWRRAQMQSPEVTVDFLSQRSGTSKDDGDD